MPTRFYLCILLAAALVASFGVLNAAAVNPLVGTWTSVVPDAAGGQHVFLQVRPDGSYTIYSTVYGTAGTFTVAPPNRWRMVAKTTNYVDGGTYHLEGKDELFLTGRLGTGKWTRVAHPPYLPEQLVFGQRVPAAIPFVIQATVAASRQHWHPDAIPTGVSVVPQPTASIQTSRAHGIPYFSVSVDIYSPSRRSFLEVDISPYSFHVRTTSGGTKPLPLAAAFVDLSKAIETARQHGMRAPFQKASMMNWGRWGTVWTIRAGPPNGDATGLYRVLSSGHIVPPGTGPMSDYVAQYNAQWNRAVAGLRNLLAQGSGGRGGCPPQSMPMLGAPPGSGLCLMDPGAVQAAGLWKPD